MTRDIDYVVDDSVARIVLARPAKKNAITRDMYLMLIECLERASSDAAVRAVLIEAQGDLFSAGNDLADFLHNPPSVDDAPGLRFVELLSEFEKPVVAAVNGAAIGIGMTLLLHCDLIIADEAAKFHVPFVDLGLVPEAGSSLLLPRLLGYHRAAAMLLLGEPLSARDALNAGLVHRVVATSDLAARASATARALAAKPHQAMLHSKRLLKGSPDAMRSRIALEWQVFERQLGSEEARGAFRLLLQGKAVR